MLENGQISATLADRSRRSSAMVSDDAKKHDHGHDRRRQKSEGTTAQLDVMTSMEINL